MVSGFGSTGASPKTSFFGSDELPVSSSPLSPLPPKRYMELRRLPLDIIPLIVEYLGDRKDLYSASLVTKAFNQAATPRLYRSLDARVVVEYEDRIKRDVRFAHPGLSLLRKPHLAKHVREIQEVGNNYDDVIHIASALPNALDSLALCANLESFTWSASKTPHEEYLASFLVVLQSKLKITSLTVRTSGMLGERVWASLCRTTSLSFVSVWCMKGSPRFLQGWAPALGPTLTHCELGRCAGVPATLLIASLAALPLLTSLRIKGAQSAALPRLLSRLPNLRILDTDYTPGTLPSYEPWMPTPSLTSLTVRCTSMDVGGPEHLWEWIKRLIPGHRSTKLASSPEVDTNYPGLESFTLFSFSLHGLTTLPRAFILHLRKYFSHSLRRLLLETTQIERTDLDLVCTSFPALSDIECTIAMVDAQQINDALARAIQLRGVWFHVIWLAAPLSPTVPSPTGSNSPQRHHLELQKIQTSPLRPWPEPDGMRKSPPRATAGRFTATDARAIMLGETGEDILNPAAPKLRVLGIYPNLYVGRWVLPKNALNRHAVFDVEVCQFSRSEATE